MVKSKLLGVALAVCVSGSATAASMCFTPSEWQAAHVRVLQQELQVAALECRNVVGHNFTDQYAAFIERFHDRLKANADLLRAHFRRVYGGGSDRELDIFVTRVTNEASEHSMQDMSFCANSHPLFDTALAIEKPKFEQVAVERLADHSAIGEECPTVAAVAKVTPAKTSATKSVSSATAKTPG